MSFKILYVTATTMEADSLKKIRGIIYSNGVYRIGNIEINLLISGIGSVATLWTIKEWVSLHEKPDLVINVGIAGSYKDDIIIGDVVMPNFECFADSGIEQGSDFSTLSEAGLDSPNEFPFINGLLVSDKNYSNMMRDILKPVRAISVNTATGSEETRDKLLKKFNPDIETLEGATFFYICIRENLPFLAVRAISNKVELRNRNNWNIPLALDNLTDKINEIILRLD